MTNSFLKCYTFRKLFYDVIWIALRGGLGNWLIHTDYFSLMKPRIRAFINRIEIEKSK
jgi:hypothetical protein